MDGLEVVIRTDKNEYVGGDTIYGYVKHTKRVLAGPNLLSRSLYVHVPNECTATSLKLFIRGHELCEYDYQYVLQQDTLLTKLGQRKARKDLLRMELKLVDHPG